MNVQSTSQVSLLVKATVFNRTRYLAFIRSGSLSRSQLLLPSGKTIGEAADLCDFPDEWMILSNAFVEQKVQVGGGPLFLLDLGERPRLFYPEVTGLPRWDRRGIRSCLYSRVRGPRRPR